MRSSLSPPCDWSRALPGLFGVKLTAGFGVFVLVALVRAWTNIPPTAFAASGQASSQPAASADRQKKARCRTSQLGLSGVGRISVRNNGAPHTGRLTYFCTTVTTYSSFGFSAQQPNAALSRESQIQASRASQARLGVGRKDVPGM